MNEIPARTIPIYEPLVGAERIRNQDLAKRIKSLLQKPGIKSGVIIIDPKLHETPDIAFGLYTLQRRRKDMPKDISYPLFALSLDSERRRFRNDDGRTYRLEVAFLFNEKGQGFERLAAIRDFPRMFPKNVVNKFKLISFPDDKANAPKYVALSEDDCSRASKLIRNAESNKLSEPRKMQNGSVIIFKRNASA